MKTIVGLFFTLSLNMAYASQSTQVEVKPDPKTFSLSCRSANPVIGRLPYQVSDDADDKMKLVWNQIYLKGDLQNRDVSLDFELIQTFEVDHLGDRITRRLSRGGYHDCKIVADKSQGQHVNNGVGPGFGSIVRYDLFNLRKLECKAYGHSIDAKRPRIEFTKNDGDGSYTMRRYSYDNIDYQIDVRCDFLQGVIEVK